MTDTERQKLHTRLETLLADTGKEWKYRGHYITPTRQMIIFMLDNMLASLRESGGDQIESGGIIIMKHDEGYDVYVHAGELSLDSTPAT